ncbi:flavodoxin family protein [Chloroflexota bacterium]
MARVLVVYHSRSGNTELMANRISEALRQEGVEVDCKKVEDADVDELLAVDGVVIGSPTYYGTMAAEIKRFLDESVRHHTKLDGKVGAAFATAGSTGQETTVLSILEALLIHGMIVQGDCRGLHYGVTSVGAPQESDVQNCRRFARRFAALVKRVCPASS